MIWEKVKRQRSTKEIVVNSFLDIVNSFTNEERSLQQEVIWLFTLDTQNRVIARRVIAVGTERRAICTARVILVQCLRDNATAFILVHNHPSDNISVSEEDVEMYETMKKAGEIVGIQCTDSIIISETQWCSLRFGGYDA